VKKKRVTQKQRFDRGGRYSAVGKTPAAPVATTVAASKTGAPSNGKPASTKPEKIKREKIRFGQAPRNALPAGPQEVGAVGNDTGLGATSAAVTPGGTMDAGTAPGTAIAPLEGNVQASSSATSAADPFAAAATVQKKTRFSDRAKTEKVVKAKAKDTKEKEKAAETPVAASVTEKATQQAQAAPLGLNGDTVKKKKKTKVQGAPKERLQNKAPTPAVPLEEIPSKAPDRGTPLEGTPGAGRSAAPSADKTTVPPATAPAPGAAPDNGPTPATKGTSSPPADPRSL
jgi:peptidyl-prolyl cis-trans isomerase SurA